MNSTRFCGSSSYFCVLQGLVVKVHLTCATNSDRLGDWREVVTLSLFKVGFRTCLRKGGILDKKPVDFRQKAVRWKRPPTTDEGITCKPALNKYRGYNLSAFLYFVMWYKKSHGRHFNFCWLTKPLWEEQKLQNPGGGGGGTPIIFIWACAAGTLRTLAYTRPC